MERRHARLLRSLRVTRPPSNDVHLMLHGTPLVRKSSACEVSQSTVMRGKVEQEEDQRSFAGVAGVLDQIEGRLPIGEHTAKLAIKVDGLGRQPGDLCRDGRIFGGPVVAPAR